MNLIKTILNFLSISLITLLLFSVTVFSQSLEWLDKITLLYPQESYLTALGIGKEKEVADNRAYNGISKIFNVKINSITLIQEIYEQKSNDKEESQKSKFNFDESIKATTKAILKTVTIGKFGLDEEKKEFYSLAVLNKNEFANILISNLDELDKQIDNLKSSEEEEESKFLKLKSLLKLKRLSYLRDELYQRLKIVNTTFRNYVPKTSIEEIENKINSFTLNVLKFCINITDNFNNELEQIFIEALNEYSFYITKSNNDDSDLLLNGILRFREQTDQIDERFFTVRWSFEIRLLNKENNKIIFSDYISDKQVHTSFERAKERVIYNFKTKNAKTIIKNLINSFFLN